jgi:hypothetical protein
MGYETRPGYQFDQVSLLMREGFGDARIGALTGIPRWTVRDWRQKGRPGLRRGTPVLDCPQCGGITSDEPSYAYLLGLYLGDGCISRHPRTHRLRIVLDARYPSIIYQAMEAMAAMRAPTRGRVNVLDRGGCVEISAYWQHWQCLFPQHGPGRKHARPILLEPWQARIAAAHPQLLLRGLIHSDGCRVTNRVWGGKYSYPRYFFTNKSSDILEIFRAACDVLGISYRNSKPDTISIAKRKDVAALDSFIGPKT